MTVALCNVNFTKNSTHRYLNVESHLTNLITFENCRMIHTNVIKINTLPSIVRPVFNRYGYGYYILDNDTKKYYFFVDDYNYVNDNVTEISVSIDWFTTDFKYLTFANSFVERIHPARFDADYTQIRENINYNEFEFVKDGFENFGAGGYKYLVGCCYCFPPDTVLDVTDILNVQFPFGVWENTPQLCGVCTSCVYYVLDTLQEVNNVVRNCVNYGYNSGITGIYKVSANIISGYTTNAHGKYFPYGNLLPETVFDVDILADTSEMVRLSNYDVTLNKEHSFGSYTPSYSKLYADEFNQFYIQNDTSTKLYNPSQFSDDARFYFYATIDQNQTINFVPANFKKSGWACFEYGLSETYSVSGVMTADNTQQQVNNIALGNFNKTLTTTFEGMTGNFTGAVATVGGTLFDSLQFLRGGGSGTVTTFGSTGGFAPSQLPSLSKGFSWGWYSVNQQSAEKIDKYFSMFGYQVNENMMPYLRSTYSYIKGDINLNGSICELSMSYIKDLFARGLTIWNNSTMFEYDV